MRGCPGTGEARQAWQVVQGFELYLKGRVLSIAPNSLL